MRVLIASQHQGKNWLRQTPKGDGVWKDFEFILSDEDERADWLVVYDRPPKHFSTTLDKSRRILFLSEPDSVARYPSRYVNQFGIVVSTTPRHDVEGILLVQNTALPWLYGLDLSGRSSRKPLDWQALSDAGANNSGQKGLVSVVCSTKVLNINQQRRLRFLEALKHSLGEDLTIFGRGFEEISDKRDGIDGYRYHLVLENNLDDHGWTEKLADPIIGNAFPLFGGGRGVHAYFSEHGLQFIDLMKPQSSLRLIENIIRRNLSERSQKAMEDSKKKLMMDHNIFNTIRNIIIDKEINSIKRGIRDTIFDSKRKKSLVPKIIKKIGWSSALNKEWRDEAKL